MHLVRICDGKRGHENQTLGLAEALARRCTVTRQDLQVDGRGWLCSARVAAASDARTRLVLGAGHATHVSVLRTASLRRARSLLLMRPSLPRSWFDLCVVPEHDGVTEDEHTWLSLGALNPVRPGAERDPELALVLLGGPSRQAGWDDDHLLSQLDALLPRLPRARLVTSRRTPRSTVERLRQIAGAELVPFDAVPSDWLATTLPRAAQVWVSEDSVSMAYEAASTGAAVGLIAVPRVRPGRNQAAMRALLASDRAVALADHLAGTPLLAPTDALQEADRIAARLLETWPELAT